MKKVLICIAIIALLTGCTSTKTGMQNIVVANPKMNQITYEIDEKLVGKYVLGDVFDGKSMVVGEEYFEIKSDGSVEMSISTFDGVGKITSDKILITAFYQHNEKDEEMPEFYRITLSFTLKSGDGTFPGSFLSLDFESSESTGSDTPGERYNVFYSRTYMAEDSRKFVKQS